MPYKRIISFLSLALLTICTQACNDGTRQTQIARIDAASNNNLEPQSSNGNLGDCARAFDPQREYFPDKISVEYAKGFSVKYERNYKIVKTNVSAPDRELPLTSTTFVLVQCGTPAPKLEGELSGAHIFQVPVRTVAVTNPGELAMLRLLGLSPRVVATDTDSIYPEIAAAQAAGKIQKIGYSAQVNLEAVVNINPELLLILTWTSGQQAKVDQARRLGLPVAPSHAWIEPTPLGHAEWLKYIALFFNKEREANNLFGDISGSYERTAAQAKAAAEKPTAFLASSRQGGGWYVDRNGKGARLLEDAGAMNALADTNAPTYPVVMSDERVIDGAAKADYWIMDDHADSSNMQRLATALQSVSKNQVYDPFRTISEYGKPDYYGTGVTRPDLMLKDFVSVFHPELLPKHEKFLLRQHPPDYVDLGH